MEDPGIASGSNTVCTALILIMCQVSRGCLLTSHTVLEYNILRFLNPQNLNGLSKNDWSSHCEGAVRLLCARLGNGKPLSGFERAMRLHLQGIMVRKKTNITTPESRTYGLNISTWDKWFQGLWRRDLRMHPTLFDDLTKGLYNDGGDGTDEIMTKRTQIPRLLSLARGALHSNGTNPGSYDILEEIGAIYKKFTGFAHHLRSALTTVAPSSAGLMPTQPYGACLILACVSSCMLRGLVLGNPERHTDHKDHHRYQQLLGEAEELADATLVLAPEAAKRRPIGAVHMMANCVAAWVCTSDVAKKAQLESVYREFRLDFSRNKVDEDVFLSLRKMEADLYLIPSL